MAPPSKPVRVRFTSFPIARLGAALAVLAWLLPKGMEEEAPAPKPVPLMAEPPRWVVDTAPGAEWWGLSAGGLRVPPRPFKEQKRPPCTPRLEEAIGEGCWVVVDARPPCPSTSFEHSGKCYLPVKAAPKLPTSVDE